MTSRQTPRRLQQEVSVQQIGQETLVYDERRHRAFCLNESASVVWRLADGTRTAAEIRDAASLELRTPVGEELVQFALEQLRRDGLLEADASAVQRPGARPALSRRVMLQRLGVGGALLLPAIAAIVAPTAAQAYSGCVDCSDSTSSQSSRARRLAAARKAAVAPPDPAQP